MSTKVRTLVIVTVLIAQYFAFGVVPADAITYYVRKTGSNGNTGTSPDSAFLTIGAAAQAMVAGDAVWIGAGTYSEQVTCPTSGNAASGISYLGDTSGVQTGDAGNVIISSGGIPFNGNSRSYITVAGVTISGGSPGMSFDGCSSIAIQNCDVSGANNGINVNNASVTMTNSSAHNNSGQGIYICGSSNVTITACNFYSNTAYGIYAGVSGSPTVTVGRTKMYSNTSGGISNTSGAVVASNCIIYGSWDGVDVWNGYSGYPGGNLTLQNCVITENNDDCTWINAGSLTVINSIGAFNHSYGINVWGGTCTSSYNAFWSNGYATYNGTPGGIGEIVADPLFTDEPGRDFHLGSASPCIDSGTTISNVTVDFANNSRPAGGGYDMGAYESGSAPSSHGVRIKKWIEVQ
jgi:parallel beta-helix repeat protein